MYSQYKNILFNENGLAKGKSSSLVMFSYSIGLSVHKTTINRCVLEGGCSGGGCEGNIVRWRLSIRHKRERGTLLMNKYIFKSTKKQIQASSYYGNECSVSICNVSGNRPFCVCVCFNKYKLKINHKINLTRTEKINKYSHQFVQNLACINKAFLRTGGDFVGHHSRMVRPSKGVLVHRDNILNKIKRHSTKWTEAILNSIMIK